MGVLTNNNYYAEAPCVSKMGRKAINPSDAAHNEPAIMASYASTGRPYVASVCHLVESRPAKWGNIK